MIQDYNILIVADTNCLRDMADIHNCRAKLYDFLNREHVDYNVVLYTCTGKYSFGGGLPELDVNDKNKTSFARSIEYYLNKLDSVVIITNYDNEPYFSALTQTLYYNRVSSMTFPYEVR